MTSVWPANREGTVGQRHRLRLAAGSVGRGDHKVCPLWGGHSMIGWHRPRSAGEPAAREPWDPPEAWSLLLLSHWKSRSRASASGACALTSAAWRWLLVRGEDLRAQRWTVLAQGHSAGGEGLEFSPQDSPLPSLPGTLQLVPSNHPPLGAVRSPEQSVAGGRASLLSLSCAVLSPPFCPFTPVSVVPLGP